MIFCNKCNKPCRLPHYPEEFWVYGGLVNAVIQGQYGSTHLEDLTKYQFSLCEECVVELFKTFKTPPTKTDLLI